MTVRRNISIKGFVQESPIVGIRGLKFRELPLILGSTWDKVITRELQGYPLSVSLPVSDRLVLNRTYAGYDGGLTLAEDIYTVILNSFQ